jgi:arylsulfatase A-like enzyme
MYYSKMSWIVWVLAAATLGAAERPHIILVMADDMGWGQTGYNDHPVLKTPNLDAMASSGLRFDRFYSGAFTCSPTRATVMTGRSNDRGGVEEHGYALRLQEKTIAQALQAAGYVTGHFGKWHLNGLRGPGVPVLADDPHGPAAFGFGHWVSVTNFFDRDPLMSRHGEFEQMSGDSSEVAVELALEFIDKHRDGERPTFSVIWYGSPHSPFDAVAADKSGLAELDKASQDHYGELVAMDRSIGTLRSKLREWDIADNTLLWFCSDNGGLPRIEPDTVGGLRGYKGSIYEGGIRVPGILEWPDKIQHSRISQFQAGTFDIFPTIAEIVGLPETAMIQPIDGISLMPHIRGETEVRAQPMFFRQRGRAAMISDRYKLLTQDVTKENFELYEIASDHAEQHDLLQTEQGIANRMRESLLTWNRSVESSVAGQDYPERKVDPLPPEPIAWAASPAYQPYLEKWVERPEYQQAIEQVTNPPRANRRGGAGRNRSAD